MVRGLQMFLIGLQVVFFQQSTHTIHDNLKYIEQLYSLASFSLLVSASSSGIEFRVAPRSRDRGVEEIHLRHQGGFSEATPGNNIIELAAFINAARE